VFTGLVEEKGAVLARRQSALQGQGAVLRIKTTFVQLELGESIAIDGACLTVAKLTPGGFEVDVSSETLQRTTLGDLSSGASVNLERSVSMGARLGGHLMTGHVDGTSTLVSRSPVGDAIAMSFRFEPRLGRFIAEKGSVAVSGVSLTVNGVGDDTFDVVIIPHTADRTTLGGLRVGSKANLEVDLVARYLARLLYTRGHDTAAPENADAAWLERLARAGMT
jgi:riboflavin synthase